MSVVSLIVSLEPILPREVVDCYDAHGSGATYPSHAEVFLLVQSLIDRSPKVFLIIDAFDECSEECRNLLLADFQYLQAELNILITSRTLPNVERQFSNAMRLEVQATSDDISHYIQDRIAGSERIQALAKRDENLCELISTTLSAKAGGM